MQTKTGLVVRLFLIIKSFNLFHTITIITGQPVASKFSEHEQIISSEVDFDMVTPLSIKDLELPE